MKPTPAKPRIIIAQVDGSGMAEIAILSTMGEACVLDDWNSVNVSDALEAVNTNVS